MLINFAVLAAVLLGCAAFTDILYRKIPNAIPASIVALFAVAAVIFPENFNWIGSLAVAGAVLAAGVGLFAWGKVGGGDVKLLVACSLWAGVDGIGAMLVLTALSGGVLALLQLAPQATWYCASLMSRGADIPQPGSIKSLPYGVAIAVGASYPIFTQFVLI